MKKLQELYYDDANKIVKLAMNENSAIKNLNFLFNLSMVTTDTEPVPKEPKTFTKAWNHLNPNSCTKWQEEIKKEFADMITHQVFCKTKKNLMPSNQSCMKTSGSSRSSPMVSTGCVLSHAGIVR